MFLLRNRARKAELRHVSCERLMKKGVPPKSAAAEAVGEVEVDARVWDAKVSEVAGMLAAGVEPQPTSETHGGNMSTKDLHLALEIKEVGDQKCLFTKTLPLLLLGLI